MRFAKTKELFAAVIEGKADQSRFTPGLQKAMAQSHDRVAAYVKTLGPIQSFTLAERTVDAEGVGYRYKVEYTGMTLFLALSARKDGIITRFSLQPE